MFRYYVLYKPFQVLCQFSVEGEKKTLADILPGVDKNIYPVGRLDYDSEGLLILTSDKELTNHLLNPVFAHKRTYYVQVEGRIDDEAVKKLNSGVTINVNGKPYKTQKAEAGILKDEPLLPERNPPIRFRKSIPTSWIKLTLTEGKNRQVRKMTAAVGYPTLRLVRYSIGDVNIDGMLPGEYKEMDAAIKKQLFSKVY